MYAETEIKRLVKELVNKFKPEKVIVFGSQADGTATENSDIDFCVIVNIEALIEKKRELRREINKYLAYDCDADKPFDLIIYAAGEWETLSQNKGDFAHIIKESGVVLHG